MAFKSDTQPFCRFCGKPIRKATEEIKVFAKPPRTHSPEMKYGEPGTPDAFKFIPTGKMTPIHVPKHVIGAPKTKAQAQTLINMKIVSVKRSVDKSVIASIHVWDGESYVDGYFCCNDHAQRYAYYAVKSPHNNMVMIAYRDARDKLKEKAQ